MGEKAEPKISLPEVILIGLFLLVLDLIDLIPLAGDITDMFAAPLVFYYVSKNINGLGYILSLILDAIPVTQEFPSRSIVWIITVIWDHFAPEKLKQAVEQAGEALEGDIGEEGLAEGAVVAEQATADVQRLEAIQQEEQAVQNVEEMKEETQAAKGKPSDETTERDSRREKNQSGQEEGGEDDQEEDNTPEQQDLMRSGAEISPEEEAAQQDFTAPDPRFVDSASEEEEEKPDRRPKVIDISSRKKPPQKRADDDRYKKAA